MDEKQRKAKNKYKKKIEILRIELYPTDEDIKVLLKNLNVPKTTFIKALLRDYMFHVKQSDFAHNK